MEPDLTIIVIEDAEKDPRMIERFLFGLRVLNGDALHRVQVVAVTQRADSQLAALLEDQPFDAVFVQADHPRADDGYPIWDICAAGRQIWPIVAGQYVTFAHAEFLYGPGRLGRTCRFLREQRPTLALGNLRRLGIAMPHWKNRLLDPPAGLSETLCSWIDRCDATALTAAWDHLPTTHWCHWRDQVRTDGRIDEDVFYARRDWLEVLQFFWQDQRQPYQDVYDLIRTAYLILAGRGLDPECPRLMRHDNELFHIDHPRHRQAYSLACYRWFLGHRDRWLGTSYADDALWSQILCPWSAAADRHKAISEFRHSSTGTVTRWAIAFQAWLKDGGEDRVRSYLDSDVGQREEAAA